MTKKYFFFDMDGTVTPSRHKISSTMKELMMKFPYTIAIISGSHNEQMSFQMDGVPVIRMGQNGNHVIDIDGTELWFDKLSDDEKAEIMEHANTVWAACDQNVPDKNDLFEDRGSQISLSIYGHHADPVAKKAFDGDFKKRQALLKQFPFVSNAVEVKLGGSTCLDYFKKGRNKGFNIARLIKEKGWKNDGCVFFGDALFPGGNDESVVGVIATVAVISPEDTEKKLRNIITS